MTIFMPKMVHKKNINISKPIRNYNISQIIVIVNTFFISEK